MKLKSILLISGAILLSACASKAPVVKNSDIIIEEPPMVQPRQPYKINEEELYSNSNVIYYPLDKPAGDVTHKFPQYRGVLENTTGGGYTVFDPSVTVYAIEQGQTKPSYLPEYSVPKYAEQYEANIILKEQAEMAAIPPIPLTRQLTSFQPSIIEAETPRPPRTLTNY